jgi:glycosyltransferase involved in cell wall biosynthesis
MKILVVLPIEHPSLQSIDGLILGQLACSGTIGAMIRLANMLVLASQLVVISSASSCQSNQIPCIRHSEIDASEFDVMIIHQTHWNGSSLTFGNSQLKKAILYLQNQTTWEFIASFIRAGGYRVVCPSMYHANLYRALPEWTDKFAVISNSYCSAFIPTSNPSDVAQKKLLFVGAITPSKGFNELMQIWSYLVKQKVELELEIAGGISLHSEDVNIGSLGVADSQYEHDYIQPWCQSLAESSRPNFLGALCPIDLQKVIVQSWAVIVNPCWSSPETFGVSAVDAQACNRTVFGVNTGGLVETVYQDKFQSLTKSRSPETLGDLILYGLRHPDVIAENSRVAGTFVRKQFSNESISAAWLKFLTGETVHPLGLSSWSSSNVVIKDLMRWTGTGMTFKNVYSRLLNRAR